MKERRETLHLTFTGIMLFFFWRNWLREKVLTYLPTLWYIAGCDLLYYQICEDYKLWRYVPEYPLNQLITNNLYSILVLPIVAYLYLLHYPKQASRMKQTLYMGRWVLLSLMVEGVFLLSGRIELLQGYAYWMEPFFYMTMFFMLRLHQRAPFLTYGISVVISLFLIWYFRVPIH